MIHHLHDLQLAVLEPLVLQDFFDRDRITRLQLRGLEHHPERPVPHHANRLVRDLGRVGIRHPRRHRVPGFVRVPVYAQRFVHLSIIQYEYKKTQFGVN